MSIMDFVFPINICKQLYYVLHWQLSCYSPFLPQGHERVIIRYTLTKGDKGTGELSLSLTCQRDP